MEHWASSEEVTPTRTTRRKNNKMSSNRLVHVTKKITLKFYNIAE